MKSLFKILALLLIAVTAVKAQVNFNYNNHCINNLIYFEDQSLLESNDEIIFWQWDFGDGGIATDQHPIHAYTESGQYMVSLTVKTIKNEVFTKNKRIDIKAAPFAFFNKKELCESKIKFSDNTFASASHVKMWMWDFGDGGFSMERDPEYIFNKDQSKVHLKVLDENGCWDSITQSVKVKHNPKTGFDINAVVLSNPSIIKIQTHNNVDSVFYLINNELVKGNNPYITLPANKNGIIKQKVITSHGCADSTVKAIKPMEDYYVELPTFFNPVSGYNKTFSVSDQTIVVNEFEIVNMEGKPVFNTNTNTPWDGTVNGTGTIALPGVYVYTLSFVNADHVKVIQKGKLVVSH